MILLHRHKTLPVYAGDGLSMAGGEGNWMQHEELQDRT